MEDKDQIFPVPMSVAVGLWFRVFGGDEEQNDSDEKQMEDVDS